MNDADTVLAPIPLSVERHGMRRWRRFQDYDFARARRMVPVVLAEAEAVAASMPLVFAKILPDSAPQPVALLRHSAANTPFIDARGQWLAAYVPALLRVHPFTARPAPEDPARMILLVDESDGFVTDNVRDARFFDPFGAADPALEAVVTFFQQFEVSNRATRAACATLQAEGLFQPLAPEDPALKGISGIDRRALSALDDAAFLRLRASGALDLAHAHFVGRAQLDFLRRAEAALAAGATPEAAAGLAGNTVTTPSTGVSDFLAALAAAEDDATQDHAALSPYLTGAAGRNRGQE